MRTDQADQLQGKINKYLDFCTAIQSNNNNI